MLQCGAGYDIVTITTFVAKSEDRTMKRKAFEPSSTIFFSKLSKEALEQQIRYHSKMLYQAKKVMKMHEVDVMAMLRELDRS